MFPSFKNFYWEIVALFEILVGIYYYMNLTKYFFEQKLGKKNHV